MNPLENINNNYIAHFSSQKNYSTPFPTFQEKENGYSFFPETNEDLLFHFLNEKGIVDENGTLKNSDYFVLPPLLPEEQKSIIAHLKSFIKIEGSKSFQNYDEKIDLSIEKFLLHLESTVKKNGSQISKKEIVGGMVPYLLKNYFLRSLKEFFSVLKKQYQEFTLDPQIDFGSEPLDTDVRIFSSPLSHQEIKKTVIQFLGSKLNRKNFPQEAIEIHLEANNLAWLKNNSDSSEFFVEQFMFRKLKKVYDPANSFFIIGIGNRQKSLEISFIDKLKRTHHFRSTGFRIDFNLEEEQIRLETDLEYAIPAQIILDIVLNNLFIAKLEELSHVCCSAISKISHGKRILQKDLMKNLCTQFLSEKGPAPFFEYSKIQLERVFHSHHAFNINEARNLSWNFLLTFIDYIGNNDLKDLWIWSKNLCPEGKENPFFHFLDKMIIHESLPIKEVVSWMQLVAFITTSLLDTKKQKNPFLIQTSIHDGWSWRFYTSDGSFHFYIKKMIPLSITKTSKIPQAFIELLQLFLPNETKEFLSPPNLMDKFPKEVLDEFYFFVEQHSSKIPKELLFYLHFAFLAYGKNPAKIYELFMQANQLPESLYCYLGFILDFTQDKNFYQFVQNVSKSPIPIKLLFKELVAIYSKIENNSFFSFSDLISTQLIYTCLKQDSEFYIPEIYQEDWIKIINKMQKIDLNQAFLITRYLRNKKGISDDLYINLLAAFFNKAYTTNGHIANLHPYSIFKEILSFFENPYTLTISKTKLEKGLLDIIDKIVKKHPNKETLKFINILVQKKILNNTVLTIRQQECFHQLIEKNELTTQEIIHEWKNAPKKIENPKKFKNCLYRIANIFTDSKEYKEALESYILLLKSEIEEDCPYQTTIEKIENLLSLDYLKLGDFYYYLYNFLHLVSPTLYLTQNPLKSFKFYHLYIIYLQKLNHMNKILPLLPPYAKAIQACDGEIKDIATIEEIYLFILFFLESNPNDITVTEEVIRKVFPFLLRKLNITNQFSKILHLFIKFKLTFLKYTLDPDSIKIILQAYEKKIEAIKNLQDLKEVEIFLSLHFKDLIPPKQKIHYYSGFISASLDLKLVEYSWYLLEKLSEFEKDSYLFLAFQLVLKNCFSLDIADKIFPFLKKNYWNNEQLLISNLKFFIIQAYDYCIGKKQEKQFLLLLRTYPNYFQPVSNFISEYIINLYTNFYLKKNKTELLYIIEIYSLYKLTDSNILIGLANKLIDTTDFKIINLLSSLLINQFTKTYKTTILYEEITPAWCFVLKNYPTLPFEGVEKFLKLCLLPHKEFSITIPNEFVSEKIIGAINQFISTLSNQKKDFSPAKYKIIFDLLQDLFFRMADSESEFEFFPQAIATALREGIEFLKDLLKENHPYEKSYSILLCFKKIINIMVDVIARNNLELYSTSNDQTGKFYDTPPVSVLNEGTSKVIIDFVQAYLKQAVSEDLPIFVKFILPNMRNILKNTHTNSFSMFSSLLYFLENNLKKNITSLPQNLLFLLAFETRNWFIHCLESANKNSVINGKPCIQKYITCLYLIKFEFEFEKTDLIATPSPNLIFLKQLESIWDNYLYPIITHKNIFHILDRNQLGEILSTLQNRIFIGILAEKNNPSLFKNFLDFYIKTMFTPSERALKNNIRGIHVIEQQSAILADSAISHFYKLILTVSEEEPLNEHFHKLLQIYTGLNIDILKSERYKSIQENTIDIFLDLLENFLTKHFHILKDYLAIIQKKIPFFIRFISLFYKMPVSLTSLEEKHLNWIYKTWKEKLFRLIILLSNKMEEYSIENRDEIIDEINASAFSSLFYTKNDFDCAKNRSKESE